ncbi:MAG: NUMOD4 domain-containing protein [bacterium]|nr:NUMOD4 domain-containing protein [bacterium]
MVWKSIPGYEGYYEVSDTGEVRGVPRVVQHGHTGSAYRKSKNKSQWVNQDGYLVAKLSRDGTSKNIAVHRLVALAFLDNPDRLPEVHHKDHDRTNNDVSNLEWIDHDANVAASVESGHYKHYGADNPNYGNRRMSQRYQEEPELRRLQSRPGGRNGRAVGIRACHAETYETMFFETQTLGARYLIENGFVDTHNEATVVERIRKARRTGQIYAEHYFYLHPSY